MSKGEEIVLRQARIVACLSVASESLTTREIRERAGLTAFNIRSIQRDLERLGAQERVKWDDAAKGWMAGKRLEEDLDRLLSYTALTVFGQLYDNLLPRSLQESLRDVTKEYKRRLAQGLGQGMPEADWLKSLVLGHSYHWLERPVSNGAVREAVEEAILSRCKLSVRMKYLPHGQWWHTGPGEWIDVSIRNFVLDLPNRPSIIVERHDLVSGEFGGQEIRDIRTIWPLELIEEAKVLTEPAKLLPADTMVEAKAEPVYKEYVLAIDPLLIEEFTGTWFVKYLTDAELGGGLIGINPNDGWGIYRMRCPEGGVTEWMRQQQSLIAFLDKWMEYVEVIEPFDLRLRMREVAQGIAARYEDMQPMTKKIFNRLQEECDEALDNDEVDHSSVLWWFDPGEKKMILSDGGRWKF